MKKKILMSITIVGPLFLAFFFLILPPQLDKKLNGLTDYKLQEITAEALELHQKLFIADLHADSLLGARNLGAKNDRGHVDIPRMIEGNMGLQFFTVVTQVPLWVVTHNKSHDFDSIFWLGLSGLWPVKSLFSNTERALYQSKKLHHFALSNKNFRVIKEQSELNQYIKDKVDNPSITAGLLGIEGAHALDGSLENLGKLFEAGFRMIGLAHFFDNEFAGSAHGEKKYGLTEKGRELIIKMNKLGAIVDISHSSEKTIQDVLALSLAPVLSSHTGLKGTCDNERNLSDEQVQSIAQKGGLIGIAFFEWAICGTDVQAIVKAIMYGVKLVGPRHIALGSDFDGAVKVPFDVSHMSQITQALIDAGLPEKEIRLIMGENIKRFLAMNLRSFNKAQ